MSTSWMGIVALTTASVFSCTTNTPDAELKQLNDWLAEGNRDWVECPDPAYNVQNPAWDKNLGNGGPQHAKAPWFGFSGPEGTKPERCRESGPYFVAGSEDRWFIQLLDNLPTTSPWNGERTCNEFFYDPGNQVGYPANCKTDFIRICSVSRVDQPRAPGPCKSKIGVGSKGCEICVANERQD